MPRVSIVIPLYNRVELTRRCVEGIRRHTVEVDYEVLLVDNASSDGTGAFLATLAPPFRGLPQARNLGFSEGCNAGAAAATGEYLLFLNNDTVPCPGWLPPMLRCLEDDPGVGIVGSKLLFPDCDLIQHAGVVFNENGDPSHVYYKLPGDLAEASVARDYPVVTGACLLVRRTLFSDLGGFDPAFVNGYEDVDFCLKARERGLRSRYCPESVLYHHEGMTEGRKRHEDRNLALVKERWGARMERTELPDQAALVRLGRPLLRASSRSRYALFAGRTLYLVDRVPPRITTFRSALGYALARLVYGLRYLPHRARVRRLRRACGGGAAAATTAAAPPRGRDSRGRAGGRPRPATPGRP